MPTLHSREVRQQGKLPAFKLDVGMTSAIEFSYDLTCWWEEAPNGAVQLQGPCPTPVSLIAVRA